MHATSQKIQAKNTCTNTNIYINTNIYTNTNISTDTNICTNTNAKIGVSLNVECWPYECHPATEYKPKITSTTKGLAQINKQKQIVGKAGTACRRYATQLENWKLQVKKESVLPKFKQSQLPTPEISFPHCKNQGNLRCDWNSKYKKQVIGKA